MPIPPLLGPILVALAALLLPVAGFGHRFGMWRLRAAFAVAAVSSALAAIGTALCLLGLSQDSPHGAPVTFLGLAGAVVGLVALAIPARRVAVSLRVPSIGDLSTDPDDPPRFVALAAAEQPKPPTDRAAPPAKGDLKSLDLALPVEAAFAAAQAATHELGWHMVAVSPEEGRFEATATTFWFGFTGNVVVRVRPHDGGSRVDIRSVSLSGARDFGANATRVREFLDLVGGGG